MPIQGIQRIVIVFIQEYPSTVQESSPSMANLTPSTKTVRVIEVEFAENNNNPRSDSRDFQKETGHKKPNLTSEGEKMVGVRMTKSGNFWAEIRDPLKKRWVWRGVFGTAEEASRAYLAEESKFAAAGKLKAKQRVGWAASDNSPFQDSVPKVLHSNNTNPTSAGKKIEGVSPSKCGKYGASIRDPFKKKTIRLGSFTTAEEASRVHLAKKAQFEAKQLRIQKAQFEAKQLRAKRRIDRLAAAKSTFLEGARKRTSLIRRSKSGKFTAEITNPITKRLVYLGTFATEEEATRAYLAKEAEFAAEKLRAKWRIDKSDLTSFLEGVRTKISGVWRKKSGKYTAKITNPITKRHVLIGTFATKVEATRAYHAKEAEFVDELRAKQGLARVASEESLAPYSVSSVLEIETSHLSNETGVAEYVGENKVSGEQEAGFGVFNGVHVVDKNGFLVGEFSMLDDFSICSEEEDTNN